MPFRHSPSTIGARLQSTPAVGGRAYKTRLQGSAVRGRAYKARLAVGGRAYKAPNQRYECHLGIPRLPSGRAYKAPNQRYECHLGIPRLPSGRA